MRSRTVLIAVAAGLALADASVVTLALPELLVQLDTTVEGVAAVIGVYTIVLAALLIPAERVSRQIGASQLGMIGFGLFGFASLLCGVSSTLPLLLLARALQAAGGAAALIAGFELLHGERGSARQLWLGAAVLSAAVGPALGGALTQAFSWRAIFYAQAPIAAAAAVVASGWRPADDAEPAGAVAEEEAAPPPPPPPPPPPLSHAEPFQPPSGLWADRPAEQTVWVDREPEPEPEPAPAAQPRRRVHASQPATAVAEFPAIVEPWRAQAALAFVSAALSAVLFLLVLVLVAGWAMRPLAGALTVTVLPVAALLGSRLEGDARWRAAGGCALVGAGTLALAWLPTAHWYWTIAPQALAGLGMGLSLPALAGELLPERNVSDAAKLLTLRHVGIALALLAVTPITTQRFERAIDDGTLQFAAVVLDAKIDPGQKLQLAPAALEGINDDSPRQGLRDTLAAQRGSIDEDQRAAYDDVGQRADDIIISAVRDTFFPAFIITGLFALLGALLLISDAPLPPWLPTAAAAGIAVVVLQLAITKGSAVDPVKLANPCLPRELPNTGGFLGGAQDRLLELADRAACADGATREELVLALEDDKAARDYERKYGKNPRSASFLLQALLG